MSTFTNETWPIITTGTPGTPIGLLLTLTQAGTQTSTQWTNETVSASTFTNQTVNAATFTNETIT